MCSDEPSETVPLLTDAQDGPRPLPTPPPIEVFVDAQDRPEVEPNPAKAKPKKKKAAVVEPPVAHRTRAKVDLKKMSIGTIVQKAQGKPVRKRKVKAKPRPCTPPLQHGFVMPPSGKSFYVP